MNRHLPPNELWSASQSLPSRADAAQGLTGRAWVAVACTLSALALVVVDAAIVNVALPAIARSFHVTPAESVHVVTAYQVALVMALLPCSALGESLGFRRVYTLGAALFAGASALCAWAPSLDWLVAARFLQGLGGAAILSLGIGLLRSVVPPTRLGAAIGWNALTVALSSAAGPSLGALVLAHASWPWLFAINLPLFALVLVASRALPELAGSKQPVDLTSAVLNATGFGAFVWGAELVTERIQLGVALMVSGLSLLGLLVRRELPKSAPMIPLDLLREHSFRVSVIASVCCFVGQSAAMVALPFLLHHELAQSALHTGLFITPWPLTVALTAPLAGRLADRIDGAWLCAWGGVLLAVGLLALALWPRAAPPTLLIPCMVLCGAGFGLFQVPNNRNLLIATPKARSGAAGGMQSTARLTGQTVGGLLMTLLFAQLPLQVAPRLGLGAAALLTLVAGLVSTQRAPFAQ